MRIFYQSRIIGFLLFMLLFSGINSSLLAQVRIPFTQRTSQYSPDRKIYNLKGDFQMIGNSNMTLRDYNETKNNSRNDMIYVDVDNDGSTWNSSSATLQFSTEKGANPNCSKVVYAGLYWTGRAHDTNDNYGSPNTFTIRNEDGYTKRFDKSVVKLKHAGASGYTTVRATTSNFNKDIYYPTESDGYMYSAYAEVTDYVREHGLGEYFVADMALREGTGDGTGFYGGWGMIVIYENVEMKLRDITVFDGYAYVAGSQTISHELPISGFHTVQKGPVDMKLGLIAGEGDTGISGDYFEIRNHANTQWIKLKHDGNTEDNFFNGSISTGGNPRNLNRKNNVGMDVAMFSINNPDNSVITNEQTSTKFRYGSTQDTYIITCIAMAVESRLPEPEALNAVSITSGGGYQPGQPVKPGQEITYKVEIRNPGPEAINNLHLDIPIPYTTTYVSSSAVYETGVPGGSITNGKQPELQVTSGGATSIHWEIGDVPKPEDKTQLYVTMTYTLRVTDNCYILSGSKCEPSVAISGVLSGEGAISEIRFRDWPMISGYTQEGECKGVPITDPLEVNIDAEDYIEKNCKNSDIDYTIRILDFCNPESDPVPFNDVYSHFPVGTRFYSKVEVDPDTGEAQPTADAKEYTSSTGFPKVEGEEIYYAIPPGKNRGCYSQFKIRVTIVNTKPVGNDVTYCQNETATPLTGKPTKPEYILYYYTSATGGEPQTEIIPSTATVGVTEYWVAEGTSTGDKCISPERAKLTVTVSNSGRCTPFFAIDDINQTPQLVPVSGNLLTNDIYTGSATISTAQYYDASGALQMLPVGTATTVYGKDKKAAGTMLLNANGTYTFTPNKEFTGSVPFKYSLKNDYGNSNTASLTINVVPVTDILTNNPPVANNDTYTIEQSANPSAATIKVVQNDIDPDGDVLNITSATALNSSGTSFALTTSAQPVYDAAGVEAGTAYYVGTGDGKGVVFTPKADYVGSVPLNYTISDGKGGTSSAAVTVSVRSANETDNVFANDDAYSRPAYQMITGNVLDNDTYEGRGTLKVQNNASVTMNGTTYQLTLGNEMDIPNVGRVTLKDDGTIRFVPAKNFVGTVPVVYTATNGTSTSTATAYLTSLRSMGAIDDRMTIIPGTTGEVPVQSNDILNGQIATIDKVTLTQVSTTNSGVTLNTADGKISVATGTPPGVYEVVYRICDKETDVCKEATVYVTVPVDSDGDGVYDIDDLDDDNDGILDTDECPAQRNLFQNGGLNASTSALNFTPSSWLQVPGGLSYNGSTPDNNGSYSNNSSSDLLDASGPQTNWGQIATPFEGTTVVGGFHHYYSVNDPSASGRSQEGIRQTVSGLTVNAEYTIYLRQAVVKSNTAQDNTGRWVIYGNGELLGATDVSSSALAYNDTNVKWDGRTVKFIAKESTITFDFLAQDDDPMPDVYMGLDDVKLFSNTECDLDGDGIPNRLDLDSDGDGCYDAVEGDENVMLYDLDSNGRIDIAKHGGVNAQGVPNFVNSGGAADVGNDMGQGIGESQDKSKSASCNNYWMGNTTTTDPNTWSLNTNWTQRTVPGTGQDVEFATNSNNGGKPAVNDLHLDHDRVIGNLINASDKDLIITTNNQLTINGKVMDGNDNAGTIIVKSAPNESSGTLIFKGPIGSANYVGASVEFYSKALDCDCGTYPRRWQYFGIPLWKIDRFPFETANPAITNSRVNRWDETVNGNKWIAMNGRELVAFAGYEITNQTPTMYTFKGTLYAEDKTIPLTKTANVNYSGMNLIGNSYTAAIPISEEALNFSSLSNKTVYLFNTGARDEWHKFNGSTQFSNTRSGQYKAVPVKVAGSAGLPDIIPSMHAFMVQADAGSSLTIKYDQLVKNATVDGMAWRSSSANIESPRREYPYLVVDVMGEGSADRTWLFENAATTRGFDSGWDGAKMPEAGIAQLSVKGDKGEDYQVATVPKIEGTSFGFTAPADGLYRLSITASTDIVARALYLLDTKTRKTWALDGRDGEFIFTALKGDNGARFAVIDKQQVPKESIGLVNVYYRDKVLVVDNSSGEDCTIRAYDIGGRLALQQQVKRNSIETLNNSGALQYGVYVVKSVGKTVNEVQRVMVD